MNTVSRNDWGELTNLVVLGAPLHQGDHDGRRVLHFAASEGNLQAVKFLVEKCGVDPNPKDRWTSTPLEDAIRSTELVSPGRFASQTCVV